MGAYETALKHCIQATTRARKASEAAPWMPTQVGFGPGEPLRPMAPLEPIRREDYLTSRNIIFTPRSAEQRAITYAQMRALADLNGVLRTFNGKGTRAPKKIAQFS